ncbi:Asp-tRNA(Asn)/Glu-tRNA(Gln) amidotransferase subunit GatA [Armatimonas rosea]|uniref:Glutamyl-tRNA(Gln) amidotransferase subunit A n=1 Tax=Armatimonas rosea TaxID=685828 RepID=A0A7W9WAN5_ARMRO|nr:Asp-tRNA(Asn)/Glu-tRNA(Gln) amidotransferase subunit GatA [Armatimonas rosea]MBB6053807.1 aspartyl-tRNA(Asn)/glutamyl-tRNA(Gln) amidotransferase subunit A [Armatimonas rosea]
MELTHLTATQIAAKVKAREVSARAVTEAFLARIAAHDEAVGAFLTVLEEQALAQADAVDAKLAAGEDPGPLAGVPVALKDNLCTRGIETTCASKILAGFVPPYSATVVEKLEAAGAIAIGKTNLDEFAMGSSTENSALKLTHNPWDLSKVPGGSSGGSAAAVAADFAPLSLGSDTGGSIRQPASFCGVVGVKPTYGRVSRYGLVAFASSLDQIGPFAKNIEDAALAMTVLSGHDSYDSTSVPREVPDYTKALTGDIKGLRIGVPTEYFAAGIASEIRILVQSAIGVLRGLGAEVAECSLPHTEYTLPAYYIVAPAEASSNLARYDGVRYGHRTQRATSHIDLFEKSREEGFGDEVKRRILIGTYALSAGYYDAFYLKAQQVRTLIQQDFEDAFQNFDVLITPTAPTTAFGIGEKTDDPLAMKLSDICTLSANLAGIPALSQCCGFDTNGLPVGMQLLGPAFSEELLFKVAHAYEQATDWHTRRASL